MREKLSILCFTVGEWLLELGGAVVGAQVSVNHSITYGPEEEE